MAPLIGRFESRARECFVTLVGLAIGAWATGLAAADPAAQSPVAQTPAAQTSAAPATADPGAAEAAILRSIRSYVAAYNRGDAEAVAAHWSETGEWTSPSGERRVGREAITDGLREMFADHVGTTIDVLRPVVRLLSPDVAVERGTVVVRAPGEESERSTYVALHVKRAEGWKLDGVYETAAAPADDTQSRLEGLEPLVGEWTDSSPEADVGAKIFWLKNKSYLNYSFRVAAPGADDLEGTQVVGWDAATGSIRSWMFDSDGGRGEGTWTKTDKGWVVKLEQTLPDGRRASSTNVYTFVDDDTLLWRSVGRKIGDEFLPNIDDVKLVRKQTGEESRPGSRAVSAATAPGTTAP